MNLITLARMPVLLVAVAGVIDAIVGEVWDQLAVLGVVTIFLAVEVVSSNRRPTVRLRRDLHRWIADRAATEGEPAATIATRAVATYREHLLGEHTDDEAPPR